MFILKEEDEELYARVEEQNLNRQYELLTNCIEIGLMKGGPGPFDKYLLWALNHVAVANISQFGGRFRREPIYVGDHKPPHFNEVDDWMDRFISTVQENWHRWGPTDLAAYALWRLNWIHPFIEGNGRTARAACYYVLSRPLGHTSSREKDRPRADQGGQEGIRGGAQSRGPGLGRRRTRLPRNGGVPRRPP